MSFRVASLSVAVAMAGFFTAAVRSASPDKSGVKPSAISLPTGAGSIEGLGESFEPQLNTGSSGYGISIAVPPGRAGLQPKIRLAYNSNLGNSAAGLGWSFDLPMIKRQTDKGFPTYTSADVYLFGGEELVPLSDGSWRCENESGFQRFRQIDSDGDGRRDAWEMTERSGVRHLLGRHRSENGWSVVEHPNPFNPNARAFDRTYCWALDATMDLHGNRIDYTYLRGDGILYPARVIWSHLGVGGTTNYHEVFFQYEGRPDAFDDYRPTFSVRTDRRLKRIEVRSFYAGASHLVRAYGLDYGRSADGPGLDLGVSLLRRFTQFDRSGTTNNYLPPLQFSYTPFVVQDLVPRPINLPPLLDLADSEGRTQIVDFNGDGLPDVLRTGSTDHRYSLNLGETFTNGVRQLAFGSTVILPPVSRAELNLPDTTLTDYDGDGLADIVRIEPQSGGGKRVLLLHANRASLDDAGRAPAGFAEDPIRFSDAPSFISFSEPNVRQMDVNFDKTSDWVRTDGQAFYFYWRDPSGEWQELRRSFLDFDDIPGALSFGGDGKSNPQVHLADLNGDRLLDLVFLDYRSGPPARLTVYYWPYCGLGRWGAKRQLGPAFDLFDVAGTDDILVQDLTGDGLADLAIMKPVGNRSELELRVNIAGQRWSEMIPVAGLPRHQPRDPNNPTAFRQADLNGSGSTDLLWYNRDSLAASDWNWLELLPHGKPNLLKQIDNGLGKVTEIAYGSSTEDLVRARDANSPWQTFSAFPVQVVRRIRTTCGQDLDGLDDTQSPAGGARKTTDQYVSEFRYRDAFYDAFEREFRGFAFAERVDYGDDFLIDTNLTSMSVSSGWDRSKTPTGQVSGPSLVTRFRYLTGASDGVDNDEYPAGWTDPALRDEISPHGGREEEILKGLQIWQEKVDPWVLHDPARTADFDRGCFLAVTSLNSGERRRMTPDDFVYSRARQRWSVRRLYRPAEPDTFLVPDGDGVLRPHPVARPSPPGRFEAASPKIFVVGGEGGSGRSVSFAFVSAATNEIIEANGILRVTLSHPLRNMIATSLASDYDDYGNQVLERDFGVVHAANYDDERITTTEYALHGEALTRWIIDKPSRVRTTDESGVFVSEARHYYDGAPYQGLVVGTMGARALLHRVEQVVTDAAALPPLASQSDRAGDPRLPAGTVIQIARSAYDAYGNSIVTLDPLGNPENVAGAHARQIDYDSTFRTYPTQETIVVGGGSPNLVISAKYDLGFGVIISSTDFNSNITSYEYDSFARLVAIVKPYDSAIFPTAFFQYLPGDPNRSRVYSYDRAGNLSIASSGSIRASSRVITRLRESAGLQGTHVTVSYTDGCGRKLAHVKESDTAGQWIVSGAQSYNRRMASQSDWLPYDIVSGEDDSSPPHFGQIWPVGRPPATSLNSDPTVKTDKRYDPTGREIVTINPAETLATLGTEAASTSSSTHFLPLEKRLFDENDSDPASPYANTPMVQFTDGLGRLIRVLEVVRLNDDGTPGETLHEWPTQYQYDLNDNLTHITDSQGNQKWFRYDGLKRKLFMNDPDRGVMTYTYDDASNLRSTIDAKSQTISYSYDGVNRLLTEHYRPTSQPPDVTYHYDAPYPNVPIGDGTTATTSNTKGMLAWVEDLSGEEFTSYDARGRVEFVVKRIPDPQFLSALNPPLSTPLVSYRTAFAYDSLDRVTTLTYADNDEVTYLYNARNLLSRITGGPSGSIISNIVYRPSDQLRQIGYGNGVRTTYDYDPRLRLNSLITRHSSLATEFINFAYDFDGVSNIKSITDNRSVSAVPAGSPRRNTQVFQYDDLYRITRATYNPSTFNSPPSTNFITYRYDRIGNMLAQNSDIAHFEKGLSVTDLGTMSYGGSSGRSNRIGRQANEPPGPHALSSITGVSPLVPRPYPYDSNGNMTVIDGLTNTWDFKDRLIAVEDATTRAVYSYDYTDRRVMKRVWSKGMTNPLSTHNLPLTTVLYPDKYFEVREHDAPTKYVWNGNTRVARVTGSLSTNLRTQRLRVYPGMNLVSVAVTVTNALTQLTGGASVPASLTSAWRWNPSTSSWLNVAPSDPLSSDTVLWINMVTNATLTVTGAYAEPANQALQPGVNFVAGWGLQPIKLPNAIPLSTAAWKYEASTRQWRTRLAGELQTIADVPAMLVPGDALFVLPEVVSTLTVPESALQVRYYHQDHLGSSSLLTDAAGALVSETANYAFGFPRHEFLPRNLSEPYQFTQKERDGESGLHYFEARYLFDSTARFLGFDPALCDINPEKRIDPQNFNPYGYARLNPLRFKDPTGRDAVADSMKVAKDVYKVYGRTFKIVDKAERNIEQLNNSGYLDGSIEYSKIIPALNTIAANVRNMQFPGFGGGEPLNKTISRIDAMIGAMKDDLTTLRGSMVAAEALTSPPVARFRDFLFGRYTSVNNASVDKIFKDDAMNSFVRTIGAYETKLKQLETYKDSLTKLDTVIQTQDRKDANTSQNQTTPAAQKEQ